MGAPTGFRLPTEREPWKQGTVAARPGEGGGFPTRGTRFRRGLVDPADARLLSRSDHGRYLGHGCGLDRDAPSVAGAFGWHARHLSFTTAGMYWSGNCWPYFVRHDGRPLFVWRGWWGQRLIIDLEAGELITEGDQSERALARAVL